MSNSEKFTDLLTRIKPVVFDLTSVNGNVFSLMGHWKEAARKAKWDRLDIQIVLDECITGDYDHAVQTLIAVSTEEEHDFDHDEDSGMGLHDEDDDSFIRKHFNPDYR